MTAKQNKPDLNPIYAILDDHEDPNDCFGKEWTHGHAQCSICQMQNICMVKTGKKIKAKGDAQSIKYGPFVDSIDFNKIPKANIAEILKTTPYSLEDIRTLFTQLSNCADPHTVNIQVNYFLREYNLTLKDGVVTNI